jgi:hypothetical protein
MTKKTTTVKKNLTLLASEDVLKKDWDNEADEQWNKV